MSGLGHAPQHAAACLQRRKIWRRDMPVTPAVDDSRITLDASALLEPQQQHRLQSMSLPRTNVRKTETNHQSVSGSTPRHSNATNPERTANSTPYNTPDLPPPFCKRRPVQAPAARTTNQAMHRYTARFEVGKGASAGSSCATMVKVRISSVRNPTCECRLCSRGFEENDLEVGTPEKKIPSCLELP